MSELLNMMLELCQEIKYIKATLYNFRKTRLEVFKENWIDGDEVQEALRISLRTLQNLRDSGTLPFSRINGKFYYKATDIEKLLESNYSHLKNKNNGTK
ncbi:MAG: helix-turn-helix domain-containing protein [Bacteroidetes bacterium]|nr:helix-turn-helix domain-containing protein [Bacteroidota bacterium]MBU1485859.1 helix-turn-helix domain-containing protein [Bacteroidota bacterium]MBU1762153.1 helix-turn-helix domain-containing protein [Bacteroidota bacterium]MBU2045495.1 helix-turn-helix domain-containing protein [Bacteroidota bacterium]MBU2268126.1 helix-turn-helix domain-containing protein [Bacteroidota bacterium]